MGQPSPIPSEWVAVWVQDLVAVIGWVCPTLSTAHLHKTGVFVPKNGVRALRQNRFRKDLRALCPGTPFFLRKKGST